MIYVDFYRLNKPISRFSLILKKIAFVNLGSLLLV
jgi:hypothetical protein